MVDAVKDKIYKALIHQVFKNVAPVFLIVLAICVVFGGFWTDILAASVLLMIAAVIRFM